MARTAASGAGPYPDLAIDDFLYGHEGPWPQPTRDHPFGQAPGVYSIPDKEWKDWQTFVGDYYLVNCARFGITSAETAIHYAAETKLDYPDLSDEDFTRLLAEGLYSKFLSELDPRDRDTFRDCITDTDRYDYYKSDYTCMRVVKETHPGEAVAASIALLRRPKNDDGYHYEVLGFVLQRWNPAKETFEQSPVFTPRDGDAWRVGRYFVLQGAIHRINLIDHTEVHFPPDAINAITKTVLPKQNLVLRLLLPHLWLSLPVNNTVLEGQRSLINRNTWYPWSPFVAKGSEVRKLLPFGWYGSDYYAARHAPDDPSKDAYFDEPNSSYPAFRFEATPPALPSRYGEFLNAYFAPILKFVEGVVAQMSDRDWVEIRCWADHVAVWLPGFPEGKELYDERPDGSHFRDARKLAETLAHIVWNGSVRHSADHQTLHEMMDGRNEIDPDTRQVVRSTRPPMAVPFVLRVEVPMTRDYTLKPLEPPADELRWTEKVERFIEHLRDNKPLCWPTDLLHAHWADLLFYMPHNSKALMELAVDPAGDPDRNYNFDSAELRRLVDQFQADLRAVDAELAKKPEFHFVPLADIATSIQY